MVNYLRKAVLGASWAFFFSVWAMLAGYLFRLTLARNLSSESYGLFYSALALVITVHLFRDPGLRGALVKFIPEFLVNSRFEEVRRVISMTFLIWTAIGAVLSAIIISLAGFLAENYFRTADSYWLLIVLAAAYVLIGDYVLAYTFQGFQRLGLFASVDALRSTLLLAVALVGFRLYPGEVLVPGFAYLIVPLALVLIFLPVLNRKVFPQAKLLWGLDFSLLKRMVEFGLPVTITGLSFSVFQQSSILLLTYFGSLVQVGLLNIAIPTAQLLMSFSSALFNVVFPLSSELWARGLKRHLEDGLNLVYRFSIIVLLPLAIVLSVFSELVIRVLFSEAYVAAAPALAVLSIGTLFWVIANINFTVMAGIGRSKDPLKVIVVISVVTVIVNFILIPAFGLMGAVYGIVFGYLLALLLSLHLLRRHVRARIRFYFWLKCAFSGSLFLFSILLVKSWLELSSVYLEAFATLLVSGIVYLACVFIFRMTSISEIKGHLKRSFGL